MESLTQVVVEEDVLTAELQVDLVVAVLLLLGIREFCKEQNRHHPYKQLVEQKLLLVIRQFIHLPVLELSRSVQNQQILQKS